MPKLYYTTVIESPLVVVLHEQPKHSPCSVSWSQFPFSKRQNREQGEPHFSIIQGHANPRTRSIEPQPSNIRRLLPRARGQRPSTTLSAPSCLDDPRLVGAGARTDFGAITLLLQ